MRFAHLSDLHLGKRLCGYSLIEDQRYILEQAAEIISENNIDGVIIAGDVYDKSLPSAEAVVVFDEFLTKLCKMKKSVYIISGNHDSAERLAFGERIMSGSGVYISPVYDGTFRKITVSDEYGKLNIYLMPFVKPANVRQFFPEESCDDYTEAMRAVLAHSEVDPDERNVLVCHQFVTGAAVCGSEELSVGTLENVDVSVFDAFDYCALGHIHGPQKVSRDTVRYCGTPLKYSFSEVGHKKSLTVAEICEKGNVRLQTFPLIPKRDLRIIKGRYNELVLLDNYKDTNREDYIKAVLTDDEDIPNVMDRLRTVYPNIMQLEYDNLRTKSTGIIENFEKSEEKSPVELFSELYKMQNNAEMSEIQRNYISEIAEKIWEER